MNSLSAVALTLFILCYKYAYLIYLLLGGGVREGNS